MQTPKPSTLLKATKGCAVFLLFFCFPWAVTSLGILGISVLFGADPLIVEIEWVIVRILLGSTLLGGLFLFLGTRRFNVPNVAQSSQPTAQVSTSKQTVIKV